MKRLLPLICLTVATAAFAVEIPVQRVADDAMVLNRVAEASKRDLPQDLLKRIVNEDIEWLRGKRADGTYEYATFERLEASRDDSSFSVQPRKNDSLEHFEMRGAFVYRVLVDVPTRRMLVTKNRRVFIDHVELEYIPMNSSGTQRQSVKVEAWMEPGESRSVDFPEVARQGTVRVFARADEKAGYGNVVLTLIRARVTDNADSPFADAVASAKAILRAIDNADVPSIRAMAARIHDGLASKVATRPTESVVDVVAVRPSTPAPVTTTTAAAPTADIYGELQSIEDLLTGSDVEKREGLDRLHQLLRRLRTR